MANMIPISTVTVGSGGATLIEFTGIPQIYTDLLIKISTRQAVADTQNTTILYAINGTTGFTNRWLRGSGSSAISLTNLVGSYGYIGQGPGSTATANTFDNTELYFPNYTSSTSKSYSIDSVQENNQTAAYMGFTSGLWSGTSPINSISIGANSTTFVQYSSATLYGIRKY